MRWGDEGGGLAGGDLGVMRDNVMVLERFDQEHKDPSRC